MCFGWPSPTDKYADSIHHVQFDGNKNLVEDAQILMG